MRRVLSSLSMMGRHVGHAAMCAPIAESHGGPISPSRYAERISRSGHIDIPFTKRCHHALPGAKNPYLDVAFAYPQDCSDLLVAQVPIFPKYQRRSQVVRQGIQCRLHVRARFFLQELLLTRFRHPRSETCELCIGCLFPISSLLIVE